MSARPFLVLGVLLCCSAVAVADPLAGLTQVYDQPYEGATFPMAPSGGADGFGATTISGAALGSITPDPTSGVAEVTISSGGADPGGAFICGVDGPQVAHRLAGATPFGARARYQALHLESGDATTG